MVAPRAHLPKRILVIDVGKTSIKIWAARRDKPIKIRSAPHVTARKAVVAVLNATRGWRYEAVAIGYPGKVINGRPIGQPRNLGTGWGSFDFRKAFGCPVKVVNDAALQALGSYRGGRMLFLGLGTGLGSALVINGIVHALQLGGLRYDNGRLYGEMVGAKALKRFGRVRWERHVLAMIRELTEALQPDCVVVGGGKAKFLSRLPAKTRRGDNSHAYRGGCRLWQGLPRNLCRSGASSIRPPPQ